jgi:hypothetical protein
VLLLAVANANLAHPAAAKTLAAAGAALAGLGAAGARNGGDGPTSVKRASGQDDEEVGVAPGEAQGGDAGGGGVVRASVRPSPAARRPPGGGWFGESSGARRKSFSITRPSPRASAGLVGVGVARNTRDASGSGEVRRPGRGVGSVVVSRGARAATCFV